MKKTLTALLLSLVMLLSLAACGSDSSDPSGGTVVFDTDDASVTVYGCSDSFEHVYDIQLDTVFVNKTKRVLRYAVKDTVINGAAFESGFSITLEPGKTMRWYVEPTKRAETEVQGKLETGSVVPVDEITVNYIVTEEHGLEPICSGFITINP